MSALPLTGLLLNDSARAAGVAAYQLAKELWPLPRSITGAGLRATLKRLQAQLPGLRIGRVPSGAKVLDWIVPDEWEIRDAYLEGPDGERFCEFKHHNLHVVGYSEAVDRHYSLDELQAYLHSLPEQPDAIPYVTSYYQRRFGFCLSHRQREALRPGNYRALIDARHVPGELNYGELLIVGESQQEILLSTYVCHPSMANNELSGPCLLAQLATWLASAPRRLSYRLLFVPEMIGSIAYLHEHVRELKAKVIAGFNLSCVGDERAWSYLPSRAGNTLADRVALHVLKQSVGSFTHYHWRDRGSDESNYCAPGIDLPVASVMRSKYGSYPEYHTSLDALEGVVTAQGLAQSFAVYRQMLECLEANCRPQTLVLGEPQLGRRGLYPSLSMKGSTDAVRQLLDFISYADGSMDLIEIAEQLGVLASTLVGMLEKLQSHGIMR
jgi:aminopeptidase-like protein